MAVSQDPPKARRQSPARHQSPKVRRQPTIRLRLALLYAGLVLLAGIILLALTYALVASHDRTAGAWTVGLPLPHLLRNPSGVGFRLQFGTGPRPMPPAGAPNVLQATVMYRTAAQLVLTQGVLALLVVTLLALAAGWLVAGRILRPLQVITATARRLSAENLGGRIALSGPPDELKRMADTFDELLARLDAAVAAEKRFVATASHELRTPLAIQNTLLDVGLADPDADVDSLRQMGEQIRQVNERSSRLIDALLVLARSEQGVERKEPVDLAVVVQDALEAVGPQVEALGLRLEQHTEPTTVSGDWPLLERLAGNLIENAVRYNVPGGWVEVEIRAEGGQAVLRVANTGPVFAQTDLGLLFEPFRRGVQERTGSAKGAGLGLSIVRAVASAHGGKVEAIARPEGGLDVIVSLPLSAGRAG